MWFAFCWGDPAGVRSPCSDAYSALNLTQNESYWALRAWLRLFSVSIGGLTMYAASEDALQRRLHI